MVVVMIVPGVHRVEMALRAAAGWYSICTVACAISYLCSVKCRMRLSNASWSCGGTTCTWSVITGFPHQPDVDVVNIAYLWDRATDIPLQGRHIQRTRRAFQQFIQTLFQ